MVAKQVEEAEKRLRLTRVNQALGQASLPAYYSLGYSQLQIMGACNGFQELLHSGKAEHPLSDAVILEAVAALVSSFGNLVFVLL